MTRDQKPSFLRAYAMGVRQNYAAWKASVKLAWARVVTESKNTWNHQKGKGRT